MKINRNGEKTYSHCSHFPVTELTPGYIFDCLAILRVLQGVYFSSMEQIYSDNILQFTKTVRYTHMVYLIDSVDMASSSFCDHQLLSGSKYCTAEECEFNGEIFGLNHLAMLLTNISQKQIDRSMLQQLITCCGQADCRNFTHFPSRKT
ncbi:hypothetical protein AVEN_124951-1 [Araneus ventricosus]|uniref:Uncharacterized protein n=1 Tax=Araneus ventricosus TaxID=182803 RepID=A0A4Y2WBP0_ARAVE|nr:hypothetical protein AVEN_124951-1 [Araneus ventricosus]